MAKSSIVNGGVLDDGGQIPASCSALFRPDFSLLPCKNPLLGVQKTPALANNSKSTFSVHYTLERTRLFFSPCVQPDQNPPAKAGFFQFFPV
jgi:hypothetical protein